MRKKTTLQILGSFIFNIKDEKPEIIENKRKPVVDLPKGRKSQINEGENPVTILKQAVSYVNPKFNQNCIPVIRDLYKVDPDMGLALMDIVQLTNTGHHIRFDQDTPADEQDKMRKHLRKVSGGWLDGVSGIDGIVSRLIAQIWIGGAISAEKVIKLNLRGISRIGLVNPELIRYGITNGRYEPYQIVNHFKTQVLNESGYIKLNPLTYTYDALITDEEIPYGTPPFLSALKSLSSQDKMHTNIDTVLEMLGVLGFLQVGLEKPDMNGDENVDAYTTRLKALLVETKDNVKEGFKDGISVGFKEDHEYEFHSTSSNIQGLDILVNNAKQQVANGLKHHIAFLSEGGGSESALSIVFTKMLSQLSNVQKMCANTLDDWYNTELRLAGFRPKGLRVEFKPSTITDDLKSQQAKEIKVRNLQALYDQGIIGQEQFAEEAGYEKPNQKDPRVTRDTNVMAPAAKKEDRNKKDAKSDKGARDKKKEQPKSKKS